MIHVIVAFGASVEVQARYLSRQVVVDRALKLARDNKYQRWLQEATNGTIARYLQIHVVELYHTPLIQIRKYVDLWMAGERGYGVPAKFAEADQRQEFPLPGCGYHPCDNCSQWTHEDDLWATANDDYLCPDCYKLLGWAAADIQEAIDA